MSSTQAILDAASDAIVSLDHEGRVIGWNRAAAGLVGLGDPSRPAGIHWEELVCPADRPRLAAGLGRILARGERRTGRRFEAELTTPDGTTIPAELSVVVTEAADGRRVHVFARDISARRAADRARRDHLGDLERLLAVAHGLGGDSSMLDARQSICEAGRDLADAELSLFFEARPETGTLLATGSSGDGPESGQVVLDMRHSLTGLIVAEREPLFVGDLLADERVDHATARRLGVRAAYWQPIARNDKLLGILITYWRHPVKDVPPRVRSLLGLFAAQAGAALERADLMTRLDELARTDALTGLANRRALDESLARELASAQRTGRPLSVALLDLDHFKRYNDEHGHQAGDELLAGSADLWRRLSRASDTLGRYGGEEFLIILPDCPLEAAAVAVERFRNAIPAGQTCSAGVAQWDGAEEARCVIARADTALYEAKGSGRDRTVAAPTPGSPVATN
jgi:diguanylate cyclase (GGDEF)-like protein/PAS domain S-box-containing protein